MATMRGGVGGGIGAASALETNRSGPDRTTTTTTLYTMEALLNN